MGCFLNITKRDLSQLQSTKNNSTGSSNKRVVQDTGWKPVTNDPRYEERIVHYRSGRITRMTREIGKPVDEKGYPHITEMYSASGAKENFNENPMFDGHFSPSKDGQRHGVHRTGQSILEDLGISIKK